MWDVKSLRVTTWQLVHESFTLTMWDVKSLVIVTQPRFTLCFTLTMWDVKCVNPPAAKPGIWVLP